MKSLDSVISRSYWKQFLHEYITVRSYWTLLWSKTGSTRGISSSSLFGLMSNDTRKQSNVPNCIRKIKRFFSNVFAFWTLLNLTDMVIGSYRINGFCRSTSSWASIFLLESSTPERCGSDTFFILFWHPHFEPVNALFYLFLFILDQPIWQRSCQYFGI